MFNFGFSELIVIGVLALIFIGPKQLPEVARVVGRLLNEFKRATGDLTGSFVKVRNEADDLLRKTQDKIKKDLDRAVEINVFEEENKTKHIATAPEAEKEKDGRNGS